jgi:hypothetical protein
MIIAIIIKSHPVFLMERRKMNSCIIAIANAKTVANGVFNDLDYLFIIRAPELIYNKLMSFCIVKIMCCTA